MPTVLVVEDDPDIGKLILLLLSRAGIEAALRTDGPAGLAAVGQLRPDLVILDVGLPIMDGWQVLAAIRADGGDGPRLPVLVLSAHAQESDRARALALGADGFVLKPFRNAALVAQLRALLPVDGAVGGVR
jgi:DNA-binding response OmpR family regulator